MHIERVATCSGLVLLVDAQFVHVLRQSVKIRVICDSCCADSCDLPGPFWVNYPTEQQKEGLNYMPGATEMGTVLHLWFLSPSCNSWMKSCLCFSAILVIFSFPVSPSCLVESLQCCIFKQPPPVVGTKLLQYSVFLLLILSIISALWTEEVLLLMSLCWWEACIYPAQSFPFHICSGLMILKSKWFFTEKKKKRWKIVRGSKSCKSVRSKYEQNTDDANQYCISFLLDQNWDILTYCPVFVTHYQVVCEEFMWCYICAEQTQRSLSHLRLLIINN